MAMMSVLLMGVLLVFLYIYLIARVISFFFAAIGLHRMAKNKKQRNAWLAYIPFVQNYTLGKVVGPIKIFKCNMHRPGLYLLILSVIAVICKVQFSNYVILTTLGNLVLLIFVILKFIVFYNLFSRYLNSSKKAKLFTVLSIVFGYFCIASYFIFSIRNKQYCCEDKDRNNISELGSQE